MTNQPNPSTEVGSTQLLSTKQASLVLGMSEHWLKASRFKPELSGPVFVKVGRSVRYDLNDINEWIASRKFRGTHEAFTRGGTPR